jgi:hypothetical protein
MMKICLNEKEEDPSERGRKGGFPEEMIDRDKSFF